MPLADTEAIIALKSCTVPGLVMQVAYSDLHKTDPFIVACYKLFNFRAENMLRHIFQRLVSYTMTMGGTQQRSYRVYPPAVLETMAAALMRMELHRICRDLVLKPATAANKSQHPKTAATKRLAKLQHR